MNKWNLNMISAAEIMTAAVCPLSCSYCYIPKAKEMQEIHEKIIEKLKSGEYFESIKKFQGNEIESLGFWGTEPLLTLPIIQEQLPKFIPEFPKLKTFSFSTSLMLSPQIIVRFVKAVDELGGNREFTIGIQISVDGPEFITDINRVKGAAETVKINFEELVKSINNLKLKRTKVDYRWKPTLNVENMQELMKGNNIEKYLIYFKNLNDIFKNYSPNPNTIMNGSYVPTIAVPGKYTTNDGKIFKEFILKMEKFGGYTAYSFRLDRLLNSEKNILKKRQLTCSGGDSNFAVEDYIHICHRSLYLNDKRYVEAVLNSQSNIGNVDNWDVSLFEKESIDFIAKNFIVNPNNKIETDRFLYTMRGYHDFWSLDVGYVITMAKELALAGQADKEFLESEDYCILFSLFLNVAIGCPMENLLNTGTLHFTPISLIRMFGNGAFKELLRIRAGRNK